MVKAGSSRELVKEVFHTTGDSAAAETKIVKVDLVRIINS